MILSKFMRPLSAKNSFLAQIFSAGALAGTSDILTQKVVEKREKWDYLRTAKFAGLICFLMAPLSYKWFQFLERQIPGKNLKVALKRTAADQIFAAPIFTSIFLLNLNLFETKNLQASLARTSQLILPIIATNYKVWPFIQLVNLSVIPIQYRIVVVQFCGIFWNMYLSYMQHRQMPRSEVTAMAIA